MTLAAKFQMFKGFYSHRESNVTRGRANTFPSLANNVDALLLLHIYHTGYIPVCLI